MGNVHTVLMLLGIVMSYVNSGHPHDNPGVSSQLIPFTDVETEAQRNN